jgi:hypothetical protein
MTRWCALRALGLTFGGFVVASAGACSRRDAPGTGRTPARAAVVAVSSASAHSRACAEVIARLNGEPALPGSPINAGFARALLLARARAEPVLFIRAPVFDERTASSEARALRAELSAAEQPAFAFERALARARKSPELARELFLTEGYLYSESAAVAALYVNYLALGLLFREPEIQLERGSELWTLQRHDGDYLFKDGPERGQRASLLLFDRVFVAGKSPGAALHRDVRGAAAQSFSDELRIDRLTDEGAVGALRFGADWLPAALKRRGVALELDCQQAEPALAESVASSQNLAKRRARVTDVLSRIVSSELDEGLPFDEPKTEEGQQDGQLRPAWLRAYLDGRDRYTFNDDQYWVFDNRGRPHVPQVCIDFVMDTLERSSGSWFRPRGERRERVRGLLDFDAFALDNRRSVGTFVSFAEAHPEWFDVTEAAPELRIAFRDHSAFFADVYAHRDEYRPFDIVTIFGLRSDGKLHYHSFFVAERDPLTGMPIAVVANAGRPRIRSWENEMQNAPGRAILAHIRPKLPWLEANVAPEPSVSAHDQPVPSGAPG